jgi:riboflavin kinase/FMN adenylyltransferase
MAAWSPDEFVRRVLVDTLHAAAVVVGRNFRFGHRAAGDVDTLQTLGSALGADEGFTVEGLDLAGGDPPWSSTLVRQALAHGDVIAAAETLGRPHTVSGVVVEGDHRGRELGYPTANVPTSGMLAVPADGVYAGTLRRVDDPDAPRWPAAVSVGTNPTFDGVERRVESYVLDRDDLELYGVPVEVAFHARLRGQVRFDGIEALVEQMADDVERTRATMDVEPGSRPR